MRLKLPSRTSVKNARSVSISASRLVSLRSVQSKRGVDFRRRSVDPTSPRKIFLATILFCDNLLCDNLLRPTCDALFPDPFASRRCHSFGSARSADSFLPYERKLARGEHRIGKD